MLMPANRVPDLGAGRQAYVVGFAIDDLDRVALIRKNRPDFQAGLFNGIGGHVEVGETPAGAMVREFVEETGVYLTGWTHHTCFEFPAGAVWVFGARVAAATLDAVATMTDEPVFVHPVSEAGTARVPLVDPAGELLAHLIRTGPR